MRLSAETEFDGLDADRGYGGVLLAGIGMGSPSAAATLRSESSLECCQKVYAHNDSTASRSGARVERRGIAAAIDACQASIAEEKWLRYKRRPSVPWMGRETGYCYFFRCGKLGEALVDPKLQVFPDTTLSRFPSPCRGGMRHFLPFA
jgi:hypothetical protein